jgi:hypothetical protein
LHLKISAAIPKVKYSWMTLWSGVQPRQIAPKELGTMGSRIWELNRQGKLASRRGQRDGGIQLRKDKFEGSEIETEKIYGDLELISRMGNYEIEVA